jgi:O-antigen/teichoic acid export membrane protein
MSSYADDLGQLFTDSGLVVLAKVVTTAIGFLAHTILVRNLEPDTFGVFSLAVTIVIVSSGFAAIGMNQTVARFISATEREKANQYIVIGVSVVLITGSFFAIIIFFADGLLEGLFSSKGLARFLRALAILVLLRPLADVVLAIARGFEKTRWKVLSNDLLPFVVSLSVLGYFVYQGEVLLGALLFYILRPVFRIVLLLINLSQWKKWTFHPTIPNRTTTSETFSFTWPLAFQGFVALFMGNMDILMLGWLSTSSAVGYYRSIQPVSQMLLFLLTSLTFIYLPIATRYYTKDELEKLDSLYKAATRWVAQATFPLFLFFLLFGQEFIKIVFSEEYVAAWIALNILSIGMYSRVFVGPNGMTIKAIDRTQEDLLASISSLITNVVLNLVLIPRYGIEGAAIATTLSFFVYNTVEIGLIYRYTGVSPFHWDLIKPIPITVVAVVGLDTLVQLPTDSFAALFAIGIVVTVIHLGSIAVTTGLTDEDKVLLKQFDLD